jgi:ribosomal protein L16 Arg81 hydroxylase
MIDAKEAKPFEETFNDWYKEFLDEEKLFNDELKKAKNYRDDKIKAARKEADETIGLYALEQKERLDIEKSKVNKHKKALIFR